MRDPAIEPWRQIDLANGAFGQGVAVTPIQLAQAYAAMVNGGVLVQPRVVAPVGDRDLEPCPRAGDDPEAVDTLTRTDAQRVTEVDFYRDRTVIPGFDVGGKTGTAQIWDAERRAVEGQPVQLLVRRLHRAREGPPRPRRRGPDRGGHADRRPPRASSRCR